MRFIPQFIYPVIILSAILINGFDAYASATDTNNQTDSIPATEPKRNIIQKIIQYFNESNVEKPEKKWDMSFIGGPSYSSSTSFELAVLAAGLYRTRIDSITPQSDISIYAEGSVTGFYDVGIRGNHFSPNDTYRINYKVHFSHFPSKFWGIGYEMGSVKDNESDYTLLNAGVNAEFQFRLPAQIFIGPLINFQYNKADRPENPTLWDGQNLKTFNYGAGFILSYDSRDLITNASRGMNICLRQQFFPKFFGNDYAFSMTELTFGWYHRFWESGIWAFQLHGATSYDDTPWAMLPTVDNGNAFRGYFEGRYRDKNEIDLLLELRQHVWRRNGFVVWGGVGSVFRKWDQVNWHTLLPSYGIGYRWEFKKRVNVRVDIGFGKHSHSLHLGINEAF